MRVNAIQNTVRYHYRKKNQCKNSCRLCSNFADIKHEK